MLRVVAPDMMPHPWQSEELLRLGGYLDPYDLEHKSEITDFLPYKLCLAAANGSGKDQYLIAVFAVWFALMGCKNRAIITSASYNQLKSQTAPGILFIIDAVNKMFPGTFKCVEFHYVCTLTASEIRLFATDEAGRAEGYHPWHGGKMAIIINEAKTVTMFGALRRCSGYSYWIEISSPGPKSGDFYQSSLNAICHPAKPELGQYFHRVISAYDCPHISRNEIEYHRSIMEPEWFQSSVLAQFSDIGESIVVTETMWLMLKKDPPAPVDGRVGIGLDLAGGGDENSCYVRVGNHAVHQFHFRQSDTTITVDQIDTELAPWKQADYVFRADDGGIGRAIIDGLVKKGWRITRTLNQSAAYNKREFLNLGAEMYFHLRRLVTRRAIVPLPDPILGKQLTSRYYGRQDTTGKFKLESKSDARSRHKWSPDRADAWVLCFFDYRPFGGAEAPAVQSRPAGRSLQSFLEDWQWNPSVLNKSRYATARRPIQRYNYL